MLIVVGVLILLPMLMMLLFAPMMGMGWWMYGPMQSGSPDGGVAPDWTLGVRFVGLLVVLGVDYLLYRGVARTETDPALAELRRAYARGDISDEELEERRRRLQE